MVCEAAAEVVTMVVEVVTTVVVEVVTTAVVIAVVAIMAAVVAIMAAVSTPVPSITVTVTVIIVAATVMVIGAAVFGSRPASSATAPAVIARGSTTTTTAVGCMNANKHTQRAAVSRIGYPMIGTPARSPVTEEHLIPLRVVTVLDETCSSISPQAERSPTLEWRSGFLAWNQIIPWEYSNLDRPTRPLLQRVPATLRPMIRAQRSPGPPSSGLLLLHNPPQLARLADCRDPRLG